MLYDLDPRIKLTDNGPIQPRSGPGNNSSSIMLKIGSVGPTHFQFEFMPGQLLRYEDFLQMLFDRS